MMPGESRCSPREIQNHSNRISGPLLDRIDFFEAQSRSANAS